jgi:hypothetical protein
VKNKLTLQAINMKNLLVIILLSLIMGCKNDIDINAPYKDIAIVYGFLDQNDPIQYIRIQKLYQNASTTSTSQGAQYADSLYFDSLNVKITNITKNLVYKCYRVDTFPKDSGFFTSDRNTFYAVSIPKNNAANDKYELDIFYPKKNVHFYSQTYLVKDASIPIRKILIKLEPSNHTFTYKFTPSGSAALYDLTARFTYKEMSVSDTNIYVIKNVDYPIAKSMAYVADRETTLSVRSTNYVSYLKSQIPIDFTKIRTIIGISYIAYGGSAEFETLLDLSKPNLSIVQKNPLYSNITNGIGIFSSRNFVQQEQVLDPYTITLLSSELPNFTK